MKKNLSVLFAFMLVASMALACGASAPVATKAPVKEPAATKAPAATEAPVAATEEPAATESPAATEAPANDEWVNVTDNLGAIQVSVPGAWSDYNGDLYEEDGYKFASISISTNLEDMYNFTAPGVDILANTGLGGYIQFQDFFLERLTSRYDCTVGERLDYTDSKYKGKANELKNCNNSGNYVVLVSASPISNPSAHVVTVVYYSPESESAEDANANLAAIFNTFDVVGTLP